jgi:hypothetical protein
MGFEAGWSAALDQRLQLLRATAGETNQGRR